MTPLCTRIYTHPFFEATPPGAAPGPPVKNRVPVFATSGGVIILKGFGRRFVCAAQTGEPSVKHEGVGTKSLEVKVHMFTFISSTQSIIAHDHGYRYLQERYHY